MAWDPDLPADNSILRLSPSYILDNWDAIETADSTFTPDGFNFNQQGMDLSQIASVYRLFSKASGGNTELFGINSGGTVTQFSGGSPSTGGGGTGTAYSWNLVGGIQLRFGEVTGATGANNSKAITFDSAFTTAAYLVLTQSIGTTTTQAAADATAVNSLNTTGFTIQNPATIGGALTPDYYYFAIGG